MREMDIKNTWGKNKVNVKLPKHKEDTKVSKTFYIKMKYLEYMDKNDIGRTITGGMNFNKGLNTLLQHGVARIEELKAKGQKVLMDYVD